MSTRPYCRVFYAGLVYCEFATPDDLTQSWLADLPDGEYLHFEGKPWQRNGWYLKDLTPVLDGPDHSDVPKELRAINLILDS